MKPVVLIVIESPEQRAVFNQALRGRPYRAVFASDGEDGFDRLREVQPDLVLAHLHAPRIDGTILCQLVRQETHGAVPVILFGEARAYDGHAQQRAESVGARQFLALEQVPDALVDAIERALSEPPGEAALPPPTPARGVARAPSLVVAPVPEEAPFLSGQHAMPVEDAGDDMPTSLTAAPEELRRALAEAAQAPPPSLLETAPALDALRDSSPLLQRAPEATPTPPASEPTPLPSESTPLPSEATPLHERTPHTPLSLSPPRPSLSPPPRSEHMLDELPLPVSSLGPARSLGSGGATGRRGDDDLIQELPREVTPSASVPGHERPLAVHGSRQRKGLDESQLGKRLVRRVQQVHQLLEHVDYYQLLGVEPNATPAQLRSAYFELSLEFHPDRLFLLRSGDIKAKIYAIFRHVSEAYAVLSDERRRAVYDEQRELRRSPGVPLAAPTPARGFALDPRPPSLDARPPSPDPRPSSLDPRDPRLQTPELRLDGVTTHAGARRYVQLAQVALKQDDLDQARLLLGLAVGLDTMNVSLRRVLEGVAKRRAKQVRARMGELGSSA